MATETETTVTAPVTEAPAKVEAAPTEEDLQFQRDKLKHVMFGYPDPSPKVEEEKKDEAKEAADSGKKVESDKKSDKPVQTAEEKLEVQRKAAAIARAAKAKKAEANKPPPEPDFESVAEKAATAAVEKMTKVAPKPETNGTLELSPKEQRTLEVLAAMESNPAHKGLADRTRKFWQKEADYAQTWEKQNPGQVFDPQAEEHKDFYARNEPHYDPDEYDEARVQLLAERIADKKLSERTAPIEKKQADFETRQRMREESSQLEDIAYAAQKQMFEQAAPELAATLGKDGVFELDETTVAKIKEEAPVAFRYLSEAAEVLRYTALELEKLYRYGSVHAYNPDTEVKLATTGEPFHPHQFLNTFAQKLESDFTALPPEEAAIDGKAFVTQADWRAKIEAISKAGTTNAQKQQEWQAFAKRHYQLDNTMILQGITAELAAQAAKKIASFNELADAQSKKKTPVQGQAAVVVTEEKPGVVKERVKPPASQGSSEGLDTKRAAPRTDEERLAIMQSVY